MRFYDTNIVAARPNLAFMPFGAGPHRCFGAAMGYLQAQFLLAQIHQRSGSTRWRASPTGQR
jgi:cytochrome P450